ncbi:MAG TPA: GntR family transcriptional regulator [Micromonosporaceae bacterium]
MTNPATGAANGAPGQSRFKLPQGDGAPVRGRTSEGAADALREAILDGVLAPGTWLREVEIAKELNVSRTPVRDAFRVLAAEGLVTLNANQGAVVASTTSDDILELYAIREVLEGLAARLAARRSPQQCLERFSVLLPRMRKAGADGVINDLVALNYEFHKVIREAAGNRYLDRSLAQIQNASRRFPDPTLRLPHRIEESIDEHAALADAISQGDGPKAEKLAVEHMRRLAELRIRMLLHS